MTLDGGERVIADRYRLIARVGGGGMGAVWRAYDEKLHRTVAVKRLHLPADLTAEQAEDVRRRTMREGRVAARLQHRHSITVFDVIEDDGCPYLVMEYLPSTTLSRQIEERGSLPPAEVARLGAQAAAALAAAHEVAVVHRDVKPGNVLLGEDGTAKITDFGISRVVEDVARTATRGVAGTPAYLSPEVGQGKQATYASDVFSLGATLYTAVEGRSPYGEADNVMKVLFRVASGDIDPPTQAGPLTDILVRMMAADPRQRPDMAEARDALAAITSAEDTQGIAVPVEEHAAEADGVAADPTRRMAGAAPAVPGGTRVDFPPIEPTPHAESPAGNRRRGALVVAAAVLVAGVVATVVLLGRDDEDPGKAAPATTTTAPVTTTSAQAAPPVPAEPPAESSAEPSPPATTTQPTTTPPSTTSAAPPPASPQATIGDYYARMPGDLEAGWNSLTPKYQRAPAGGEDSYRSFWGSINSVGVSAISASGNVVEATVDYAFKDGRNVRERHRYTLVRAGDTWKIDASTVLSSVRR